MYELPESGVCVHISGEDGVWYVCDVLNAVVYVCVSSHVVRGCDVARRYIKRWECNEEFFYDLHFLASTTCVGCSIK